MLRVRYSTTDNQWSRAINENDVLNLDCQLLARGGVAPWGNGMMLSWAESQLGDPAHHVCQTVVWCGDLEAVPAAATVARMAGNCSPSRPGYKLSRVSTHIPPKQRLSHHTRPAWLAGVASGVACSSINRFGLDSFCGRALIVTVYIGLQRSTAVHPFSLNWTGIARDRLDAVLRGSYCTFGVMPVFSTL